MRLRVTMVFLVLCAGMVWGQGLTPICLNYRPDRQYNQSGLDHHQGWDLKDKDGNIIQMWPDHFYVGAMFEAYLRNDTKKNVRIEGVQLDGRAIEEQIGPGSQIVWYRLASKVLAPGQIAQLLIRFRREPQGQVNINAVAGQEVSAEIVWDKASIQKSHLIARLALSQDRQKIYTYIETADALEIKSVTLDNYDMLPTTQIRSAYGNYLPLVTTLPAALTEGSEHTLVIEHSQGIAATRFRAWSCFFPLAVYQGPATDNMLAHHINVCWHHPIPSMAAVMERWQKGIQTIAPFDYHVARDVPGILACYLKDEPDVADYFDLKESEVPFNDRVGNLAPQMRADADRAAEIASSKLSVLVCDSTFTPTNYYIYARTADVLVMDRYAIQHGHQPTVLYPYAKIGRQANEPQPMWMLLGCHLHHQSKNGFKRYPSYEELRYMALGALAGGAQGLGYWTYFSGTFKAMEENPKLWHEVGQINSELRPIISLLGQAQPPVHQHLVETQHDVFAEVIRSAEDQATLLVLLNKAIHSDASGYTIEPVDAFSVRWTLPGGTQAASLWRLSVEGPQSVAYESDGDAIEFTTARLGGGAIYAAVHDPAFGDSMIKLYQEVIEPLNDQAKSIYLKNSN